jgi:hypothetical protein
MLYGLMSFGSVLAASAAEQIPRYEFRPFRTPAPVWDYWPLLLLPLCLVIAVVYKSIRCRTMDRVPREAFSLFMFILAVMIVTGGVLYALVYFVEKAAG